MNLVQGRSGRVWLTWDTGWKSENYFGNRERPGEKEPLLHFTGGNLLLGCDFINCLGCAKYCGNFLASFALVLRLYHALCHEHRLRC